MHNFYIIFYIFHSYLLCFLIIFFYLYCRIISLYYNISGLEGAVVTYPIPPDFDISTTSKNELKYSLSKKLFKLYHANTIIRIPDDILSHIRFSACVF